jgi:glycosyltransferase involved in cell wall biosynthesis
MVDGVVVTRYPVTRRPDRWEMARLERALSAGLALDRTSEAAWVANTGESERLLDGIAGVAMRVDALVFAPYLFASTVQGVHVRPERSVIIPCLHDEAYARFTVVQDAMHAARGLVFNSAPERELARNLLGSLPNHRVVGVGFDDVGTRSASTFRSTRQITGDVVTYAGRRERGKNFPLLLEFVALYSGALSRRGPVTLVTMGGGAVDAPRAARPYVVDIGFVSRDDKLDAIASGVATTMLSTNESFSYFVSEGWLCGVPAVVHTDAAVTHWQSEQSGGGLWVRSAEEFAEALDRLRGDPELRWRMGSAGRAWVLQNYSWPAVLERFEAAIGSIAA